MAVAGALRTSLSQALVFSARISRRDFWRFVPLWSLLCALVLVGLRSASDAHRDSVPILGIVTVLSLPIWSAGARRFQDTGEPGTRMLYPFFPFVLGLSAAYVTYTAHDAGMPNAPYDPAAYVMAACLVAIVPSFFGYFLNFQSPGFRVGQLLVPPQPGPNIFGPNPHEVTR